MADGPLPGLLVGVLPVLTFLGALIYLDSYKLVRLRAVLALLAVGCAAGGLCFALNVGLLRWSGIEFEAYARYIAPVLEEAAKGAVLVLLIRAHRIGFLVDAAISGFAVGTGFAVIENLYYLGSVGVSDPAAWIVRGFGTAIMHGGAAAIFGMLAKSLSEGARWGALRGVLAGLTAASLLHSGFNHFLLTPVLSTALIVLVLPPLMLAAFHHSERGVRRWLDVGFDADTELLGLIHSGGLSASPVGTYLNSLKEHFRGEVVADLLCYLRLHVELSLRAKGHLMMREAGFRAKPDPEIVSMLEELTYLQRSIGRTGRLALSPFLRLSSKDLWQIYSLRG